MTIRTRLLAGFTAVVALLVAPLVYGINRLVEVREIAVALRTRHAEAFAALGGLRTGLVEFDRQARSYVIAPDPLFRAGARDALARARRSAEHLSVTGYDDAARTVIGRLDSLAAASTVLETLVEGGRAQGATDFLRAVVHPVLTQATDAVTPIGDAISTSGTDAAAAAQEITATAIRTASAGAALALLLGAIVALGVTGALTRPLRRLRAGMVSVAGGTLATGVLPEHRADEIGDLCRSFRAMAEQLVELDRIRGEFLNVVSHDLKAPLNLINGCAELIEEEAYETLGPEQRKLLESIRQHVALLTDRVNKLLSLGRLEARAYPIHPEVLPVAPMFEALQGAFEPQARRQGIDFRVTVDRSAAQMVRADPDCFYHEVLGNLVSNAFKFTPRGGRVAVRVWGEEGELRLSVADTGVGIPADKLPHVFNKYYQVGRPGAGAGAGLGLAIARQVVEAHDGRITVRSSTPGGTVFQVTLPASVEPPLAARRTVPRRAVPSRRGPRLVAS